jgi:glutamine synthetase type III
VVGTAVWEIPSPRTAVFLEQARLGVLQRLPGNGGVILRDLETQRPPAFFNGNNYAAEWHAQAEKLGLPNLRSTPDALTALDQEDTKSLFDKYQVLSPRELASRYETYVEQYIKSILVEGRLTLHMAKTAVLPAALRYQGELSAAASNVKAAGLSPDVTLLREVTGLIGELQAGLSKLARLVDVFAKRPQVQERLTTQVADSMVDLMKPGGVIVVIEAEHLCMTMRGVRKPGAKTLTSAVRGQLRNPATRSEAMSLIIGR